MEENKQEKVSLLKATVSLACIQNIWDTTPKDEILFQQIATSIQTLLTSQEQLSYPVMFSILLLRSLN